MAAAGPWLALAAVIAGSAPIWWTMLDAWSEQTERYHASLSGEPLRNRVAALLAEDGAWAALRHVRAAVRTHPEDAEVHFELGVLERRVGTEAAAREAFERAVKLRPRHARAHAQLGRLAAREAAFEPAFRHYRDAVRASPGFARAHLDLGFLYVRRGYFRDAARHFDIATRAAPESARAHALLGGALSTLGETDRARAALERALELDPEHREARFNLALLPPP